MPFNKVSEFKKSFPAIAEMPMKNARKAMKIFNALKADGMGDGKAIAIAMTRAKDAKMSEEPSFEYIDIIKLSEKKSIIEVLKAGKIHDRNITITESMLDDFVKNFNEGVYGTEIQVNLGHNRGGEAAGWVKKLIKEGERLLAEVEWTPLGIEKITSKQYRFTSSELRFEYNEPNSGKVVKNVFTGVALTNIPAVKGMAPVSLSEESSIYINNQNHMEELQEMFNKLIVQAELSESDVKAFEESEHFTAEAGDAMLLALKERVELLAANAKLAEEAKAKAEENVSLAERLEATEAKTKEMSDKIELTELEAEVKSTLCFSEDKAVGISPSSESVSKVSKFMLGLSQVQKAEFKEIMLAVQTVDLNTYGATSHAESKTLGAELSEANKEAQKRATESGRPLHECLGEVYMEMGLDEKL